MNFNSMTFWVIVVLVVLYGIVCILETLSKDKNAQSGFQQKMTMIVVVIMSTTTKAVERV